MASVELKNVSRIFRPRKGAEVYAVSNLDLHVGDRELITMVGPSGCGKTTTLRMIAGLERPSAGTIEFDGANVDGVPPQDRDVAMVFQRDALYPHMTAFENMAFGLRIRGQGADDVEARVRLMASTLGIAGVLERFPRELSSGQRQRVALGRAAVRQAKVFLLDEPLSSLDAPMRVQMRREIVRLHRESKTTMIYVTHDQAEAMTLGQRVAVMHEGALQQCADPQTLYNDPANLFVAGFIGSPPMNLIRGRVERTGEQFLFRENNPAANADDSRLEVPLPGERATRLSRFAEGNVVLGIRPEHVSIAEDSSAACQAAVDTVEPLGAETLVTFNTGAHTFTARVEAAVRPATGERAPIRFQPDQLRFFNPASGTPIL